MEMEAVVPDLVAVAVAQAAVVVPGFLAVAQAAMGVPNLVAVAQAAVVV